MLPGVRKRVFNFHDVLMYVAIARKHLRLMILLMCFAWLAGLVYYVYARPVYYSRALLKVNQVKQAVGAEKEFNEVSRLPGIIKELRAPHIIANTAAQLGVKASHQDVMKYYVKKVEARRNSEENIEIEIYPYSYDWSKRWAETMLNEYIRYRDQRRLDEMKERLANYAKQRAELDQLMAANQSAVTDKRAEVNLAEAKIKYEQLRDLHDRIILTEKRIEELGRVKVELLNPSLSTVEKLSIISRSLEAQAIGTSPQPNNNNAPGENPPINVHVITPTLAAVETSWHSLEKELHSLETQKAENSLTYLEEHSVMRGIQAQIDAVKVKLEGELTNAMRRLDLDFNKLLENRKELNAQLPEYEKRYSEFRAAKQRVDLSEGTLAPLVRLQDTLAKEMQRMNLAYDNDRVELAYGGMLQINDIPVSPNRLLLFIYTTALGLLMALGIPFLVEYLDHTLSNLEQVESTFQLRGLGIIPKVDNADTSVALLDSPQAREQNLLENFRVIRTNLLSMGALSKPPHVLMITSAMPKEGKTVVSTNLALSFAQTGGKTLLMDTDLRRGRLHRFFGYRKQPGLSGVLLGQNTLDEAIRPTPHENLFIVSAGQHLETGTELLGSPKFHELMQELRKRFDRIVLDTPPVLGLSETSVLQSQVDGVLFVIWSGYTPIKGVKAAVEMLQANGANFYGFVLNRLDLSTTANYYQYYYYSHDYYYQYSPRSLENA